MNMSSLFSALEAKFNPQPKMEVDDVPQNQPLNSDQVKNKAGGFVYKVDDLNRLRRFLTLGAEKSYYCTTENELAIENVECIQRLIADGRGEEAVETIKTFSIEGRTAKQNPIILALAMCCRSDNAEVKKAAYGVVADVCRIPTHLFLFVKYCETISKGTGWGRAHRRAIGNWYLRFGDKPMNLAVHVTKYKNREGWSHKDVLRLAHPKPREDGVAVVLKYVVKGLEKTKKTFKKEGTDETVLKLLEFLEATEEVLKKTNADDVVTMITRYELVREHVPTNVLNDVNVWWALLQKMPLMAMIRNLGKMSAIELIKKDSEAESMVVAKLKDTEALRKARIHPFNVLLALYTYRKGHGDKGSLKWQVSNAVTAALDDAFYASFKFVEPTNKRYCLALDVSGSMTFSGCNGSTIITPREASAALAMVTARTEKNYEMIGFSNRLVPLDIRADMQLKEVIRTIERVPMGMTDCAQPMIWAKENKKEFDVFIVYTDCETWVGKIHPSEALRQYRTSSEINDAKLIVCAMTSNGFTLADPDDPGMLDMAGFDSNGPQIMNNFVHGMM